MKTKGEDPYQS